jgi:hypothetical protein
VYSATPSLQPAVGQNSKRVLKIDYFTSLVVRSGSVVSLASVATGTATNYSLSATSSPSDSSQFSHPSFTAAPSGSTLTGGTGSSLATPAVTLYIYDGGDRFVSGVVGEDPLCARCSCCTTQRALGISRHIEMQDLMPVVLTSDMPELVKQLILGIEDRHRCISGAPGETRTPDPLLRSHSNYFAKSCQRSG